MLTNGAGQGLLAEDWDVPPDAATTDSASPALPAPHAPHAPHAPPAAPVAPHDAAPTSPPPHLGLILPDRVALMLATALHGDRAPNGTPDGEGQPRSKNLTVIVGTVRVVTTGRGEGRRIFTELGAAEYRYELSINEVVGDGQSAARASYRLPITMSDAVRSRAEHLLVDGQRIAILGPLGMEEYYDQRFQRDAYDAGRRTWDIRIDVIGVQEIGDDVPDMAWVQLEGEVVDRPRIYTRQYGDRRTLVEHYAGVTLRYREVLAASFGRAVRPVVKSIPVEVLISAEEAIIPASDALLRPGNKVRIEGRLSPATFRLPRAALEDATVQTALERTRSQFETRNADLAQRAEAARQQRLAAQERAQREGRQGQMTSARQQPLTAEALERQIARAQQRLLTGRRVRVEVGYVGVRHTRCNTFQIRHLL
ncbi:hypothetical protein [Candidatus Viridilinea mediisalina]|uniref:Uncharacterized protein n=1 Tax=Candidatus Viridilinea mediisalina TaxID=2024553 RepID=A0A2A6RPT6_9CHLR|nr:hypothetical protein [Candidatus Viridilinea mediisalina]PDW05072.1 hypothetical protein CJ255_00325 [Candidatus Viridilinea mediisalina]